MHDEPKTHKLLCRELLEIIFFLRKSHNSEEFYLLGRNSCTGPSVIQIYKYIYKCALEATSKKYDSAEVLLKTEHDRL